MVASRDKNEHSPTDLIPPDQVEDDEEYNEEEDEDYKDEEGADEGEDDDGDVEDDEDDKKEIKKLKYDQIESSEGGLIKTRTQRAQEETQSREYKRAELVKTSVDIDSLWEEMNKKPEIVRKESKSGDLTSLSVMGSEKIKIKSTYEFAGKVITKEKWVDSSSAELKLYLGSVKLQQEQPKSTSGSQGGSNSTSNGSNSEGNAASLVSSSDSNLRRPKRKRPSLLDAIISGQKTLKLSTLEKSRLDWSTYVDKTGIQDELKRNNKGGYLEKQDFLNRVQLKLDENYKSVKQVQQQQKQLQLQQLPRI